MKGLIKIVMVMSVLAAAAVLRAAGNTRGSGTNDTGILPTVERPAKFARGHLMSVGLSSPTAGFLQRTWLERSERSIHDVGFPWLICGWKY